MGLLEVDYCAETVVLNNAAEVLHVVKENCLTFEANNEVRSQADRRFVPACALCPHQAGVLSNTVHGRAPMHLDRIGSMTSSKIGYRNVTVLQRGGFSHLLP